MSSSDFEAQLRQSVADNIALISNAAKAAKARIGESVAGTRPPPAAVPVEPEDRGPAVNFAAAEPAYDDNMPYGEAPAFPETPAFAEPEEAEAPAFAEQPAFKDQLPQGAINVDEFAVEGMDEEGIPVWEDPP
jgi:hypothetical protein